MRCPAIRCRCPHCHHHTQLMLGVKVFSSNFIVVSKGKASLSFSWLLLSHFLENIHHRHVPLLHSSLPLYQLGLFLYLPSGNHRICFLCCSCTNTCFLLRRRWGLLPGVSIYFLSYQKCGGESIYWRWTKVIIINSKSFHLPTFAVGCCQIFKCEI